MELEDYIEEIEPLLPRDEGRGVIRCVCEISKLLDDAMPESGRLGIQVAESFLSGNASAEDLVPARVSIWKDHDENYEGTPEGAALRAVICALFFPIENHEYFDTLIYAVDFGRMAKSDLNEEAIFTIINKEFGA